MAQTDSMSIMVRQGHHRIRPRLVRQPRWAGGSVRPPCLVTKRTEAMFAELPKGPAPVPDALRWLWMGRQGF